MKKIQTIIIISFILLVLTSCSEKSFFDQLATNNAVPDTITYPVVKHFYSENTIYIQWEKDVGADEYILYRATVSSGGYSEIYRGAECFYENDDVTNETFYYYKLAKKRGQKEFDRSGFAAGVPNAKKRDACEENNIRDAAYNFNISAIGESLSANIYFYRDPEGNLIEDFDWYYSAIPPRKTMVITIQGVYNLTSNRDIMISIDNGISEVVTFSSTLYNLNNYSYSEARIYFCISVNKSSFLGDPSGTGGRIGEYRIDFKTLIPVS